MHNKRFLISFFTSRTVKAAFCFLILLGFLTFFFQLNFQKHVVFYKPGILIANETSNWYQENFPGIVAFARELSILDTFHEKVALHDRRLNNTHNFTYIHNIPTACSIRKVEIVVGVPSRTDSFDARQAIRETWGQYGVNVTNNAVVLFFLGSTSNKPVQNAIDQEVLKHGDIIQEDFVDSYQNLSIKTIGIMKWVSTYCSTSTFLLKADEDTYINMPRLMVKLKDQFSRGPLFIMGEIRTHIPPIRDPASQYFLTLQEFPGAELPNFVAGPAYAMTTTAAMRLYVESMYFKPLLLEDVYMTGLVADRASVPRINNDDFKILNPLAYGCNFRNKIGGGHYYTPSMLRTIHRDLYNPGLIC